jgi:O-antigen ligase
VLVVLVASDYKVRVRGNDQAISGSADPLVLLEVALYCAVAFFLVTRFGRPPRIRRTSVLMLVACAWVIVMVVSTLYSPYRTLAVVRAVQLVIVLVLAGVLRRHATRANLHELAHWFMVLVAGSVIIGVLFPMERFPLQQDRFTWLRLHPVQAGIFVGLATVLAVLYLLAGSAPRPGPRWPRAVYVVLLLLVGGGLVGTNTRGAALGAAAGLMLVAFAARSGRRKADIAVVLGVGAVAAAVGSSAQITAFFARGEDAQQLASLNSRTDLWSDAAVFIREQPLYGWGMGATRGLFLDTIGLGGGHNAVVNALVDTGIVGTAAWVVLVVTVLVQAVRLPAAGTSVRWDRALILGVIVFLLVDSIFTEGLAAPANVASTWLFVLVGWIDVARADAATPAPVEPPVAVLLPLPNVRAVPLQTRYTRRRQP